MPAFSSSQRGILKRVAIGKLQKTKAAAKLGISRKTLYLWLASYRRNQAEESQKRQDKINFIKYRQPADIEREILKIVVGHPEFGPQKIEYKLKEEGIKFSCRSIWLLLKKRNLTLASARRTYAGNFRINPGLGEGQCPGYLRLSAYARKRMVEDVLILGKKAGAVCREFKVSRKTFAKWKKRYLSAQQEDLALAPAMGDQHPLGVMHPRGLRESAVKAILGLAATAPELSSHQIAARLGYVGNHGVQLALERANLSREEDRRQYAEKAGSRAPKPVIFPAFREKVGQIWQRFIPNFAPAPPPQALISLLGRQTRSLIWVLVIAIASGASIIYWVKLLESATFVSGLGLVLASVSLFTGSLFFLYSLKYYLTLAIVLSFSQKTLGGFAPEGEDELIGRGGFLSWILGIRNRGQNGGLRRNPVGLEPNLEHVRLEKYPKISVQVPFYNEKNVVERAITAACNLDYPDLEVMLADDSTDETPQLIRRFQEKYGRVQILEGSGFTLSSVEVRPGLVLKHLHRTSRSGYKGAALGLALKNTDPRTEFIAVFDADFVPYPDTLTLFLKYFKVQNNMREDYQRSNVAAVQGYQWHVLNKSENWITRGVRSEYAGSYVIERAGTELYGGLKMISGSVYMIRRAPLEEVGWGTSITEDFELTLKLYEKGYKVVYTPYIQAPAECVSTLQRLVRQRMRWAEGHSNNIRKMVAKLLASNRLTAPEKVEVFYLAPYYLQAAFFLAGTLSWLFSEVVFGARLPFWTALWGWSLVLTNMLSLPLVNVVGLFLEESEEKDYLGIASFIALSYLVVPFQAYASVKGFLESREGPWFRTPKTGRITDVFTRGRFYRLISGIFGGRGVSTPTPALPAAAYEVNSYLALASANNRFNRFTIRYRGRRFIGRAVLALVLILTVTLFSLTRGAPSTYASTVTNFYFWNSATDEIGFDLSTGVVNVGKSMRGATSGASNATLTVTKTTTAYWYSQKLPTGTGTVPLPSGTWTYNDYVALQPTGSKTITWNFVVGYCSGGTGDPCGTGATYTVLGTSSNIQYTPSTALGLHAQTASVTSGYTCTEASPCRLYFEIIGTAAGAGGSYNLGYDGSAANYISNIQPPSAITVPENSFILLAAAPVLIGTILWLKERRRTPLAA